jgi:hypothetical protein
MERNIATTTEREREREIERQTDRQRVREILKREIDGGRGGENK